MVASTAVDHGFKYSSGQTKDCKIGFVASQLSMQH